MYKVCHQYLQIVSTQKVIVQVMTISETQGKIKDIGTFRNPAYLFAKKKLFLDFELGEDFKEKTIMKDKIYMFSYRGFHEKGSLVYLCDCALGIDR